MRYQARIGSQPPTVFPPRWGRNGRELTSKPPGVGSGKTLHEPRKEGLETIELGGSEQQPRLRSGGSVVDGGRKKKLDTGELRPVRDGRESFGGDCSGYGRGRRSVCIGRRNTVAGEDHRR